MFDKIRNGVITFLGVVLCLYTIVFVNFNVLQPQSALALFVLIGMVLCYLVYPVHPKFKDNVPLRCVDLLLAATCMFCFGYIFVQVEPIPLFKSFWPGGASLGDRASEESALDIFVGVIGLILVLEATRRSIGWIVPALALAFIAHSYFCWLGMHGMAPQLPDWMLPHQGQSIKEISASTFLQSLGVLGPAAGVMFKYVFLFVVFGAFLEMSGATQFIIDFAEKVFGSSPGGPAKVSVLGSGLMGSLSGSAVANAVTTGSFTIPMMRNSGFAPHIAGGITAAAASGGALVPPVMGAGAYMMLEFVERAPGKPQITFLEIARAALIPAVLYYVSLYLIVHFYSKKVSAGAKKIDIGKRIGKFEGVVFFGALTVLVSLLVASFSPFKAVTGALVLILVLAALRKELAIGASARVIALVVFFASAGIHQFLTPTVMQPALGVFPDWTHSYIAPFLADSWIHPARGVAEFNLAFVSILKSTVMGMLGLLVFGLIHPAWRPQVSKAFAGSAKNGISLVAASACVGIIIGVVQTTPLANDFGERIKDVIESSRLLALVGIMTCSLILGMGVPSVVCYLLMATLMGALLTELGIDPLAAHLFIFYFGMMSMVTPPVALAAYASASIASAQIMPTAFAAFRFSLVGFTLPFMFVYRPELLLMGADGTFVDMAEVPGVLIAVSAALGGVVALASGVTGYFFRGPVGVTGRVLMFVAAVLLLIPTLPVGQSDFGWALNLVGAALLIGLGVANRPGPVEPDGKEAAAAAA